MILAPVGGLANRLRAMFSRYEPGMRVVWSRTWDIAECDFLDVFEPVPGIEFVENTGGDVEETCHALVNYADWHQNYRLLRPVESLRERIVSTQAAMGYPYDAIHVRRTDHVKLAHQQGRYTTDTEFIRWARAHGPKVFLATDNTETRALMSESGRMMFWQSDMRPSRAEAHEAQRYNSLGDAVVDLYVCVGAREFMGSAHSSFSELVEHLRELR